MNREKNGVEMLERSRDMRGEIKIIDIESLMPKEHLLRKIDKVIDFDEIYEMTEKYYCEDNGRPCWRPCCGCKNSVFTALIWDTLFETDGKRGRN